MSHIRAFTRHDITLMYLSSLAVAFIMAVVSFAGIIYWDVLYPASKASSSVGSDAFNLLAILPILLVSMWLARRGRLIGLLLWPGALFYVLYIYAFYVVGLPFNILFLPYIVLVVLSAYTIIGLVASIDGDAVRERLAGIVPKRAAGGVLIALAVLFIVIDVYAAVAAAMDHGPVDIQTQAPWIIDLIIECPALLIGGVLLWRRTRPGYVAGAGLLLQISLLLIGVPVSFALGALVTGTPADLSSAMLIVMGVIPAALLAFFLRGAVSQPN